MQNVISTIIAVVLICTLGMTTAESQDMRFGAKAGISLYNATSSISISGLGGNDFSVDETSDRRLGFAVGAFAIIPVNEKFSFQPELMFVQKGGKFSDDFIDDDDFFDDDVFFDENDFFDDEGGTAELTFNYLDIPLLVRFDIPSEGSVAPYLTAGPVVGILLSANEKFNGESSSIDDEMKTFNFGLSLGAGVSVNQLHFDLRYEIGLANIFDAIEEEDDDFDDFFDLDVSFKTSGLMLTIGYSF